MSVSEWIAREGERGKETERERRERKRDREIDRERRGRGGRGEKEEDCKSLCCISHYRKTTKGEVRAPCSGGIIGGFHSREKCPWRVRMPAETC